MVISTYSYKSINNGEEPDKKVLVFWSLILIVLPISLIFTESSMYCIQSVTIIGAAPIGFILVLIILSFFKDIKNHPGLEKTNESGSDKNIMKNK